MKKTSIKKLVGLFSFLLLLGSSNPTIYAQLLEIEILSGGYRLSGPAHIDFPIKTSSTTTVSNSIKFSDIPAPDLDHLLISDQNGGNPFDVIVSTEAFKKIDDTDPVDCSLEPRKCIALDNFSVNNGNTIETVSGSGNGVFELNTQTNEYYSFLGKTHTITGSALDTLLVDDSSDFTLNENIVFPDTSSVEPKEFMITGIDADQKTVTVSPNFTTPPAENVLVLSKAARTATLGSGTGEDMAHNPSTGEWKIKPELKIDIPAGQLPGQYQTIINFTIV